MSVPYVKSSSSVGVDVCGSTDGKGSVDTCGTCTRTRVPGRTNLLKRSQPQEITSVPDTQTFRSDLYTYSYYRFDVSIV